MAQGVNNTNDVVALIVVIGQYPLQSVFVVDNILVIIITDLIMPVAVTTACGDGPSLVIIIMLNPGFIQVCPEFLWMSSYFA